MSRPDPYDLIERDDDGRARLKAEQAAFERFARVTAGCPCDAYPMAGVCQVECKTFKGWVNTGRC
jgi:hypothetical protein